MFLLSGFIIIFVYRFFLYMYRFLRCKRLQAIYIDWLMERNVPIFRYQKEITTLFNQARVAGVFFSTERHNMKEVATSFEKVLGCFKYEIKRNFFPNYWIKKILFAPIELIDYIDIRNVPIAKTFKAVSTLLYWFLAAWDVTSVFNVSISSPLYKIFELVSLLVEKVF